MLLKALYHTVIVSSLLAMMQTAQAQSPRAEGPSGSPQLAAFLDAVDRGDSTLLKKTIAEMCASAQSADAVPTVVRSLPRLKGDMIRPTHKLLVKHAKEAFSLLNEALAKNGSLHERRSYVWALLALAEVQDIQAEVEGVLRRFITDADDVIAEEVISWLLRGRTGEYARTLVKSLVPELAAIVRDPKASIRHRLAAAAALSSSKAEAGSELRDLRSLLSSCNTPMKLRQQLCTVLVEIDANSEETFKLLHGLLKSKDEATHLQLAAIMGVARMPKFRSQVKEEMLRALGDERDAYFLESCAMHVLSQLELTESDALRIYEAATKGKFLHDAVTRDALIKAGPEAAKLLPKIRVRLTFSSIDVDDELEFFLPVIASMGPAAESIAPVLRALRPVVPRLESEIDETLKRIEK